MITIVTPTYNRAYFLPRLYGSLCQQTIRCFEWLIIDDGSTDHTFDFISRCIGSADFKVHYHYQKNGGKHRAINTAISRASGDWILIVDSDDLLTHDAVDKLYRHINYIDSEFVGMCFRKATLSGQIIGALEVSFNKTMVMNPTMAGHILKGDLAYLFRTKVMKVCPFPEFKNENFVPELYVWNKISDVGEIIFYVDQIIYICEYLPDGYTNNFKRNLKSNPHGFGVFYRDQIIRDVRWIGKIKACIRSFQCIIYSCLRK
ncbi:glycosyltransferase family 2 protein [Aeromonas salmonicida]|uniref:glycosyltransferase family 2 protein n=1 Tax=Aeromonas salmonicida TaxID=645 RepID=UPI0009BCA9BC|nr:glycosyltransferase family A protein [Aeromonas salmonicida]MDE7526009.1 glycosyltransferase family 2 protein [Aeromonas salmonicida]MDE7530273.1 glycosyltransferase family 2 protein [Aeromonas salmonicida]MUG29667.1 glycosyltransferase family 2 protein [Aeromonas salmonicida]